MNAIITYWWISVSMDWASTIAVHDCSLEENPFMRYFWCQYGDIGFTSISMLIGVLVTAAIFIGWKFGSKLEVAIVAIPMITFKCLIALTNLAVIPYWVTGWWQY